MPHTTLITGASSGIGLELARVAARHGDDIILVARSRPKLEILASELKKAHGVKVHIIEKDLSLPSASKEVFTEVSALGLTVNHLINNAGFGDFGKFSLTDGDKEGQMIDLNIKSLTHMTKLFLPSMIEGKYGRIMNLASTAAFQPGPGMAVYFATKAYVLSFSEAISEELLSTGVTVTALCPGPTESGFAAVSHMDSSKLFQGRKLPTSREVAEYGYHAMMQGQVVAVHGWMNLILTEFVRFTPRFLIRKIVGSMQKKA
ncbi:SDR family oxidoreductase [Candidatus Gracilibacteria bacterium]|nr:SDR family oxidoreductase [Candidatus Gracilibacteria bacterium]